MTRNPMTLTAAEARTALQVEDRYLAIRAMDRNMIEVARALRTTRPTLRRTLDKMVYAGRARMITDGQGFATYAIAAGFDA